jgi:hypothetical protein
MMKDQEVLEEQGLYDEGPMVAPDLLSMMRVDLITNTNSDVVILHDKPLPGILHWMEYDDDLHRATLVMRDGMTVDLGMKIAKKIGECMMDSKKVYTVLTDGKEAQDLYMVPVITRH